MTMPKKGTRTINVNSQKFRYLISGGGRASLNDDFFKLNVTVESCEIEHTMLRISGILTRDFWLDSSDVERRPESEYVVIKPSNVATWIKESLNNGWLSSKGKKTYHLNINDI